MRIETIGNATLYEGECLALMAKLPDASVDMILCDLPYGTTACKWDTVIPFEPLWAQYRRVAKRNAAIVLTASQPFTTALIASNMREFRYCWVWDKALPTGHLNAKRQPLRVTEDVAVFYREQPTYVPQKTSGHKRKVARRQYVKSGDGSQVYGAESRDTFYDSTERYPTGIIEISNARQVGKVHPTQKPVALMEYLIRTYTQEGETVLDNCMGSGTTGVACVNTGRQFIGIELDETHFNTSCGRLRDAFDLHEF